MPVYYEYYRLQVISRLSNRNFRESSTYSQAILTFIYTYIFYQVGEKNWHYDLLIVDVVIWGVVPITDLLHHGLVFLQF